MKPQGWSMDRGMGAVRKWDRISGWGNTRGSRPVHRSDKHMRARAKREANRDVQGGA